ncbi:amidase [Methylobacterium sp. W2]|nr:amidase [Methylobacterium sp. W2]
MSDFHSLAMTFTSVRAALSEGADPVAIVAESCRRVLLYGTGCFTALVPAGVAVDRVRTAAAQARAGADLPLLGLTFSVKDNIHVAEMRTTANCPGLSLEPEASAAAVLALEAAGAVLVGKNTMDQFATGLNGTRSPEPLCRNAIDPSYIPGGSSSGSAVAVARDLVAFSLGSDTGGSGRVPAACNGIVGVKPSIGLVSGRGLLYNSRFLDCIPVFARTCADANEILRTIAGFDSLDPASRRDLPPPVAAPLGDLPREIAVPRLDQLDFETDRAAEAAHRANLETLEALGFTLVEIDFDPFAEAGRLVFQSALVAERLVDYWDVVTGRPETIHPVVRAAIEPGLRYSAKDAFDAIRQLTEARRWARAALAPFAAFVVPTVPTLYTIADMLAEPVARNAVMGRYTYFVNPMDLCAVAVPGSVRTDGLPSSLSFIGLAGRDGTVADLAARFEAAMDAPRGGAA